MVSRAFGCISHFVLVLLIVYLFIYPIIVFVQPAACYYLSTFLVIPCTHSVINTSIIGCDHLFNVYHVTYVIVCGTEG